MEDFNVEELVFLAPSQRQAIQKAIREIRESKNPLFIGKRIDELHNLLSEYGYFIEAVRAAGIVQRTAYGYMYGYRNAAQELPPGAVQAMMDRKMVINANRGKKFGEWTELLEKIPPPKSGTPAVYERWVNELLAAKPKRLTGHLANRELRDHDALLEEVKHAHKRAFKRLAPERRARERFVKACIANLYQQFGVSPEVLERSA